MRRNAKRLIYLFKILSSLIYMANTWIAHDKKKNTSKFLTVGNSAVIINCKYFMYIIHLHEFIVQV